jgi:NAD(P)-dependent dehydrogenase (short-subunit alcohol dehydrogenase family)
VENPLPKTPPQGTTGEEFALDDGVLASRPTVFRSDLMKGHRVVVTGGGSGIGRATAFLFARLGAEVAICGRNENKLNAVAAVIQNTTGRRPMVRSLSIRDPDAVEMFINEVFTELGGADTLVNNAGGQFPQDAIAFTRKGWLAVVDTNLNGTWWMMQEIAKKWRETGASGNIVNVVMSVERGGPQVAHTCASRAGVIYLSKTLAVEWAPFNIRVNCLAAGSTKTEGFRMYPDEALRTFETCNPMMKTSDAFEMAEAMVYLSSPAAAFINGSLLTIDGGQSAWGDAWPAGRPDYFAPAEQS